VPESAALRPLHGLPGSGGGGPARGPAVPGGDHSAAATQAALVEAARDGDPAAFERLVALTHRDTWTLALRLTGNREDAADVTQEVYLRAFRSLHGFRGDAAFSTWMYRITANCAASTLSRRRRHRADHLGPDEVLVDPRPDHDPQMWAEADDLRSRLLEALDDLPPRLRAVVVLRDVYEMPHQAIAEELGISVAAAKVRLHRARHRLRALAFPDLDSVGSREV
jgi:RNA polymerase sigma-70 factor (ECF subfamily)